MIDKLEFKKLFHNLRNESYALVKCPAHFPFMNAGADLDFFCRDINRVSNIIIDSLEQSLTENDKIAVKKKNNKIHLDLIRQSEIILRFDLMGSYENYKNIKLKSSFFEVVLDKSQNLSQNGVEVKVPSLLDECIIRYIEYLEFFAKVPDKLKHVDYILQNLKSVEEKNIFFDRLHYFVEIPNAKYEPKTWYNKLGEKKDYIFDLLNKSRHLINNKGVKGFIIKVFNR